MRKLYAKGNVTQIALAEGFGLSLSNVKNILAGACGNTYSAQPLRCPSLIDGCN